MLHMTKGQTASLILTLTEKQQMTAPNYIFHFKQRATNESILVHFFNADDISSFKDRFNRFDLIVDDFFLDSEAGQWGYSVYETMAEEVVSVDGVELFTTGDNDTLVLTGYPAEASTDTQGLNLLETGIMWLNDGVQHTFTERVINNEYKTR